MVSKGTLAAVGIALVATVAARVGFGEVPEDAPVRKVAENVSTLSGTDSVETTPEQDISTANDSPDQTPTVDPETIPEPTTITVEKTSSGGPNRPEEGTVYEDTETIYPMTPDGETILTEEQAQRRIEKRILLPDAVVVTTDGQVIPYPEYSGL